tara:strand:+ start:698 stop:1000 length:303 start_codon:yes stop_codon:yes gene_type:complete
MSYTSKKIDNQNDLYEIETTNNGEEIKFNVGVTSENQLDEVVAHHLAQLNGDVVIPKKTYQASRMEEYPLIQEQLDDIYHNGIDGWKKTIKAIKDKYPKE